MIKLTYKSKNRNKTMLSASKVSVAAGASLPSRDSGPPPHQVIRLGIDVHLDRHLVVRQIDGGAPQPPQSLRHQTPVLLQAKSDSGCSALTSRTAPWTANSPSLDGVIVFNSRADGPADFACEKRFVCSLFRAQNYASDNGTNEAQI
jgi:hypothetical protein